MSRLYVFLSAFHRRHRYGGSIGVGTWGSFGEWLRPSKGDYLSNKIIQNDI